MTVTKKRFSGAKMREIRKSKKISQDEMAQAIGLTQTSVSAIEREDNRVFADTAAAIADVLGVSVDELMIEEESE